MKTIWMVNGYINRKHEIKKDLCCITRPSVCRVGSKERMSAGRRQAEIKQEAGRGLQWLVDLCLVSRN